VGAGFCLSRWDEIRVEVTRMACEVCVQLVGVKLENRNQAIKMQISLYPQPYELAVIITLGDL
jgi:hypothetical protein